ncbi:cbb3-type cytochrome oxidase subunit 3 [Brucellaceae bacterium D45D]
MDYTTLRTFADSWGLLAMMIFVIAAVLYAFRPGSKGLADDAKNIPFKDEEND